MTKGYKATYNYKCKNQTYEVGQEYKLDQKPRICKSGFHYCKDAKETLFYYNYNHELKLLEIEDLSNDTITDNDKSCSNHIKITREITDKDELYKLLRQEYTYDSSGKILTYKNSTGYFSEYTYDENGRKLTYKNSYGFSQEYTYDCNEKPQLKDISLKYIKSYLNGVLKFNYISMPYIPLKDRQPS